MNRVRLGLTGLALVFLLAMIAAALFAPLGENAVQTEKGETLATLGVAPGAEEPPSPPPRFEPAPADPITPEVLPLPPLDGGAGTPEEEPLLIPEEDLTEI